MLDTHRSKCLMTRWNNELDNSINVCFEHLLFIFSWNSFLFFSLSLSNRKIAFKLLEILAPAPLSVVFAHFNKQFLMYSSSQTVYKQQQQQAIREVKFKCIFFRWARDSIKVLVQHKERNQTAKTEQINNNYEIGHIAFSFSCICAEFSLFICLYRLKTSTSFDFWLLWIDGRIPKSHGKKTLHFMFCCFTFTIHVIFLMLVAQFWLFTQHYTLLTPHQKFVFFFLNSLLRLQKLIADVLFILIFSLSLQARTIKQMCVCWFFLYGRGGNSFVLSSSKPDERKKKQRFSFNFGWVWSTCVEDREYSGKFSHKKTHLALWIYVFS